MEQSTTTAQMSAFARAWHTAHAAAPVFCDPLAGRLLSPAEQAAMAESLAAGAGYFLPGFSGSGEEALRQVMTRQIAPTPVGRAAFAEQALETAARLGARQYLVLGAGYDTFALRRPAWAAGFAVFELDLLRASREKRARIARAGLAAPAGAYFWEADLADPGWADACHPAFSPAERAFCSLLGLVYYLTPAAFAALCGALGQLLPPGSAMAFDYPTATDGWQAALAEAAGERMQGAFSYRQLERLLEDAGWAVYEHLAPAEITARFFVAAGRADPAHAMTAPAGVCYCLAVRQPGGRGR